MYVNEKIFWNGSKVNVHYWEIDLSKPGMLFKSNIKFQWIHNKSK